MHCACNCHDRNRACRQALPPPQPPPNCPPPAAPQAATNEPKLAGHEDPWLALDKLQHFIFCAAVTAAGYVAARGAERLRRHRLALGCGAGVAAGLLKEVGDVVGVS